MLLEFTMLPRRTHWSCKSTNQHIQFQMTNLAGFYFEDSGAFSSFFSILICVNIFYRVEDYWEGYNFFFAMLTIRTHCEMSPNFSNPNWVCGYPSFFGFFLFFLFFFALEACVHITLSSKLGMTFSKEHQTGVCRFDALSRAKVALLLSFT